MNVVTEKGFSLSVASASALIYSFQQTNSEAPLKSRTKKRIYARLSIIYALNARKLSIERRWKTNYNDKLSTKCDKLIESHYWQLDKSRQNNRQFVDLLDGTAR